MSSFLISKREYMKTFGLVAGIAAGNCIEMYFTYVDDRTPEKALYKLADMFYKWNLESIRNQYNDYDWECDRKKYTDLFFTYASTGAMLYGDDLKKAILEIRQFFRSALYQVETEKLYKAMQTEIKAINTGLDRLLFDYTPESWGELRLDSINIPIAI